SCGAFSGSPGRSGRIGAVRCRACTCDFSSMQSTTAFSGGFKYNPTTSRTLASNLVVFLPGIMGSTLKDRNGRLVWSPSGGAALRVITSLGRSLRALQLPERIGDDPADDGVRPVDPMPDLHVI